MDDLIRKLSVLELIDDYNSDALGSVFIDYSHGLKFKRAVLKLPSAEKTGKWVHAYDCDCFQCNQCGTPSIVAQPYCCICGAKMEVEK